MFGFDLHRPGAAQSGGQWQAVRPPDRSRWPVGPQARIWRQQCRQAQCPHLCRHNGLLQQHLYGGCDVYMIRRDIEAHFDIEVKVAQIREPLEVLPSSAGPIPLAKRSPHTVPLARSQNGVCGRLQ